VADAQSLSATTGRLAAAGILFAASLGIAIAGIHFHIVGAMVKPVGQAFGWGRGEVAFALTISAAIHPFTNILVGSLADRHGPRAVLMPGVPLFCLGLAMVGFAGPSIGSWYVLYGIFALLGGGISSVVWTMLIVDRFQTRRGLALAVSLSGAGLLVSIVPTIVLALDNVVGVNGIYPAFGLTAFVLLMPAVYFLVPRQRFTSPVERAPALAASERRTILRSRRFWQLGLAFLLVASCVGTFIVHLQPILTDAGLTREDAARIGLLVGPALAAPDRPAGGDVAAVGVHRVQRVLDEPLG
jgi:MFS family permease